MNKHVPVRRCIGCRATEPKSNFLRFAYTKDKACAFDPQHIAQGRGYYICDNEECIKKARKRKGLPLSLAAEICRPLTDLHF